VYIEEQNFEKIDFTTLKKIGLGKQSFLLQE
jgi:hypothetical protein